MKVYIVRHGESETNKSGDWTGWLDVHLTEKGVNDAKRAGEFLKNQKFDKIFTSDLSRAIETAKSAIPECEYESNPLLREVNVGSLMGTPVSSLTEETKAEIRRIGYEKYGGETKEEFTKRIGKFKKELEALEFDTVAIFSHGGWLRGFLDDVVGFNLSRSSVVCSNCAIGIFNYENGNWALNSWINLNDISGAQDVF